MGLTNKAPLFTRDFLLVCFAGAVTLIGLGLIIPLLPLYISSRGASKFELGIIFSAFSFTQFLVQPFFGSLSDRIGRKPLLIAGLTLYSAITFLYAFAESFSALFFLRLMHGVGAGMIWPPLTALIIDLAPPERRAEALGFSSGVEMTGFTIGPLLGGLFYSLGGMRLPFIVCSLLIFINFVLTKLLLVEKRSLVNIDLPERNWKERYGFAFLKLTTVKALCYAAFYETYMWGTMAILLPLLAGNRGIGPAKVGILFSAYYVAFSLVQLFAGKMSDRIGRKKPIVFGFLVYGLVIFLIPFGWNITSLVMVLVVAGASLGLYSPSIRATIADLAPADIRGSNLGIFFTARMIGFMIGPPLSGLLVEHFGFIAPFAVSSLGIISSAVIVSQYMTEPTRSGAVSLEPN